MEGVSMIVFLHLTLFAAVFVTATLFRGRCSEKVQCLPTGCIRYWRLIIGYVCKVPVLTVLLVRPRSSAGRLCHAQYGVLHHLAGEARSLRGSISHRWPRGVRRAWLRVAVRGEISTGGAAREVEYRPRLKHA